MKLERLAEHAPSGMPFFRLGLIQSSSYCLMTGLLSRQVALSHSPAIIINAADSFPADFPNHHASKTSNIASALAAHSLALHISAVLTPPRLATTSDASAYNHRCCPSPDWTQSPALEDPVVLLRLGAYCLPKQALPTVGNFNLILPLTVASSIARTSCLR